MAEDITNSTYRARLPHTEGLESPCPVVSTMSEYAIESNAKMASFVQLIRKECGLATCRLVSAMVPGVLSFAQRPRRNYVPWESYRRCPKAWKEIAASSEVGLSIGIAPASKLRKVNVTAPDIDSGTELDSMFLLFSVAREKGSGPFRN